MDPIAFKIGDFAIYWYGILVAGGFLAGLWTASRRCVLDKLDGKVISDLGVWIIIAGMIGARAMHVVTYWEDQYTLTTAVSSISEIRGTATVTTTELHPFETGDTVYLVGATGSNAENYNTSQTSIIKTSDTTFTFAIASGTGAASGEILARRDSQSILWKTIDFRSGGLVFYGGFIGAALAVILYIRLHGKQPLWKVADAFAPSIPLGHALGRLGCLMFGCCFGIECDLPWAVQFPAHSPAFDALGQAPGDAAYSLHVHPTQIYSALLNVALYGGLAWLYRHKRFDGQVFGLYLVGYSINRFIVEFFRGDYQVEQLWFDWIKPGQQLSLFLLPIGIALIMYLRRRPMAERQG